MALIQESPWLKKSIAGLLGLVGISIVVLGIVLASHPSTDMTGTVLIIVGLPFSFAAWKLWPTSESSMVETEGEGITHYRIAALWMGIVPIIGLIFWLADSTGDINGFILTCFMFSTPVAMISAYFAYRTFGKQFSKPMMLSIAGAIPLAIWEYINELNNGCSTWGWGTCPPKPPGYDMPRTIMLFYLVILGIYALSKNDFEEDKTRRYGIAYGMGFGYFIYVLAWANGMFG